MWTSRTLTILKGYDDDKHIDKINGSLYIMFHIHVSHIIHKQTHNSDFKPPNDDPKNLLDASILNLQLHWISLSKSLLYLNLIISNNYENPIDEN